MADNEGIWSRGGANIEELPDPLAPVAPPHLVELCEPEGEPKRKPRWPVVLYAFAGLFFVTLIWLIVTAPLSRALEPLADPRRLVLQEIVARDHRRALVRRSFRLGVIPVGADDVRVGVGRGDIRVQVAPDVFRPLDEPPDQ